MKIRTYGGEVLLGLLSALLLMSPAPSLAAAQSNEDVRGAWTAKRYILADGPDHNVQGQIFFAERDWQVLFFVMDETGTARRGSGEGGTYERTSDGVVFRHLFHLSVGDAMPGLAEAPLRMVARGAEDAPLEPTRVDVEGDVLTLFFPSGNRMTFLRAVPN
jgi:hypothetical protein